MDDIREYPFIFMNTPASLQNLASAEVALIVWRSNYANKSHLWGILDSLLITERFSCKEVLVVPVSHRIEAQINDKLESIGEELQRKWIHLHWDPDILDGISVKEFREFFKHSVADFSSSIGYKHTAVNMLNSGEFSSLVNYRIACLYCLEDQVKRFWPSVANESRIDVNTEQDKCNLSYWNGWMRSGGNSIIDTESARRRAKNAAYRGNVAAFDYFCKMLSDHERVSEFISLLLDDARYHPAVINSLSLRTLNRVQAEEVFTRKKVASSMFRFLTMNGDLQNVQYADRLWTLMGHSILENKSEFFQVVFELWESVFYSTRINYGDFMFKYNPRIDEFLLKIWSYASDELKAYVSNKFLRDKLFDFSSDNPNKLSLSCYGHDMTFMLEIVSKWSDKNKNKTWWQKNWRELAFRSKPLYLEQFMRICLPNDDAIELFKIQIADFSDIFKSLLMDGFYSDLKDYLIFCSKNLKQFQQLGKNVLESNLRLILIHGDDVFAKFEWFVGELFSNVPKDVEEFKTQMISSAECLQLVLGKLSSNDFSRIIGRFVTNERELQLVKHKLFDHCRTYPVDFNCKTSAFKADRWQWFLEWCAADHEEIFAFKRSLNVDAIFLKRLGDYLLVDDGRYKISMFLDRFLKWYFGNEEDAKNFKLEKVKNYQQIEVLRVEMEKKYIDVGSSMYRLLVWFFDNNTKNVGEFCKTCNCILRSSTRVKQVFTRKCAGYF